MNSAAAHHRPRMLASFTNHMIGVLDDPDHAEAALRDLRVQEHLRDQDLELLVGDAGEERLDFTGERHGLLARLRRNVQKLTDEYEHARRYELELARGHVLIVAAVRYEVQAQRMCHLLRAHGAHFIHYYGPLMVGAADGRVVLPGPGSLTARGETPSWFLGASPKAVVTGAGGLRR